MVQTSVKGSCMSDGSWSERFPSVCPTAPPYPVGIVPPRTKSPIGSPESCTIASYVTLRKPRRPEPRSVGVVLPHQSRDEAKPLFWGGGVGSAHSSLLLPHGTITIIKSPCDDQNLLPVSTSLFLPENSPLWPTAVIL